MWPFKSLKKDEPFKRWYLLNCPCRCRVRANNGSEAKDMCRRKYSGYPVEVEMTREVLR